MPWSMIREEWGKDKGRGDAYWHALDATTSQELWKIYTMDIDPKIAHYNWASPLLYQGYAYIGVASYGACPAVQGQVLKVSLSTHKIVGTVSMVPSMGSLAGASGGRRVWTRPRTRSL